MKKVLQSESGHTLLETLVAMALLGGVILLTVGSIGNLMASDRSDRVAEALRLCKDEMSLVADDPVEAESVSRTVDDVTVSRLIARDGRLLSATVAVIETGDTLLVLQKTILLP